MYYLQYQHYFQNAVFIDRFVVLCILQVLRVSELYTNVYQNGA